MRDADAGAKPQLILICLGNPGPRYARTRHNAGWRFAEFLRQEHSFAPLAPMEGIEAVAAEGQMSGMPVLLVEPTTSMNDCGRVVAPLLDRFGSEDGLYAIAHDDLDLSVGSVKGRQKGGHGGHNGVRAILAAAGDCEFFRVKLGVNSARKSEYESVADFLLADFEGDEREQLQAS
ncbi:MAG: aminoacyl-tRNA hydrolase, partial [Planctomycetota bacterium]